jgi:anti-repressor protein
VDFVNHLPQVFTYSGNQVRTIIKDGEVWFVAKDVCDVLNHSNHKVAVSRLDEDEVSKVYLTDSLGCNQPTTIVNEAGLYSLILTSNKPEAKAFKRWVTHEVLPSIRRTGVYDARIPKTFSEGLRLAADLQEKIERDKPKVESYDRFISDENYQKVEVVAKILGYGRNNFFKKLRQMWLLMSDNNPYQKYIDRGYFVVKEKPIQMGDQVINKPQTYITAKGIAYIDKLLHQRTA